MHVPHYGLNGSSASTVLDDTLRALRSFRNGALHFRDLLPHGRDYTMGQGEFEGAREEYRHLEKRIASIIDELEKFGFGVAEQVAAKADREREREASRR